MTDQDDRRTARRRRGVPAGRSVLAAAAAALLLTAVGGSAASAAPEQGSGTLTPCSDRSEVADRAIVERWLEALTSGRAAEGLRDYWAPDGTVTVPAALPYGGTYTVAEQGAYGAAVNETWDTSRLGAPRLYSQCGTVFAEARWDVTARATGEAVDQPLVEVFTMKDRRIQNDTLFYFDTAQLVEAITP